MSKLVFHLMAFLAMIGSVTLQAVTPPKKDAPKAASIARVAAKRPATTPRSTTQSRRAPARRYYARGPVMPPAPTAERYKEIQQSLAAKGYYSGEITGQWGPDSVDALKRFQADQNLVTDGKLGSLSLIALGLGPKRLNSQAHAASPPVPSDPNTGSAQPGARQ